VELVLRLVAVAVPVLLVPLVLLPLEMVAQD
jgi:hypothetical protein